MGRQSYGLRSKMNDLFLYEHPLVSNLLSDIKRMTLFLEKDRRRWHHAKDEFFMIALAFSSQLELNIHIVFSPQVEDLTMLSSSLVWPF